MDTPGRSYREQGLRALEENSLDRALDLLSRAVMADGRDAEAKCFLAVVYSRKGLAAQARRTIQNALELQPGNPDFRYWLGTILERDGDTEGAATAYRECLRRNPDHEPAAARLELMGVQPLRPDAPAEPPAPKRRPYTPLEEQEPPPPAEASPLAKPPPQTAPRVGPRGTVQCPSCHEWSKPGLSCEWCSGPLRSFIPPPYTAAADPGKMPVPAPGQPFAPGIPYPSDLFPYRKAHRGGSVMTLGILGLALNAGAFVCPPLALLGMFCTAPLGLTLSMLAWNFGNADLAEMDAGLMDPRGRSATQTGRVLGIIGTSVAVLILAGWALLILALLGQASF